MNAPRPRLLLTPATMPPIWQPLLFLLLAPAMLTLAMAIGMTGDGLGASGWPHAGRAMLHLVTLGVFVTSLLGATFQVYPVVLGQPVRGSRLLFWPLWALWPTSVLSLAIYFLTSSSAWRIGALLVIALCVAAMLSATLSANMTNWKKPPQWGLRLAYIFLAVMLVTGQNLSTLRPYISVTPMQHAIFGLGVFLPWVVMSMALHVLPLFYVHKPPDKSFVLAWHAMQAISALGLWFHEGFVWVVLLNQILAAAYLLWFLTNKRRRADATVRYWQAALATQALVALLAGLKWLGLLALPWRYLIALHLGGFAITLIMGMSQRIAAFLGSLHSGRLTGSPSLSMGQLLSQHRQYLVLKWHLAALLCLILSTQTQTTLWPTYIFETVASALWLLNLFAPILQLGRGSLKGIRP